MAARRLAVLVGCACASPAEAGAAVPGGIEQLPGAAGCVSAEAGCTPAHDLAETSNMVISPDGRTLYVAGYRVGTLTIFDRDVENGTLAQRPGRAGCLHTGPETADCQGEPLLGGPWGLAISADGSDLYVSTTTGSSVLAFDRAADGSIARKPGLAGCIANTASASCRDARAMNGPFGIALSPDGRYLYAAGRSGSSVTALAVDAGGGLVQVADGPGGYGCVQNEPNGDNCADGRAMEGPYDLAIGGDAIYVPGFNSKSVSVLSREAGSGRIAPVTGPTGCVSGLDEAVLADGCTKVADLGGAYTAVVGSGNGPVYAPIFEDTPANNATHTGRVLTFDRQGNGGIVRRAGRAGCIGIVATASCDAGRGFDTATAIVSSADGADVYIGAHFRNSGVAELDRAADGRLSQRPDTRGCWVYGALSACSAIKGLVGGVWDVTLSPDQRFLYAAGWSDAGGPGSLAIFRRDSSPPTCGTASVTVRAGEVHTLPLPCRDVDGSAFTVSIVKPPTLGSLGAIDSAAPSVVYAAPQGQGGETQFTFSASYDGFTSEVGMLNVTVLADPPPPPPPPLSPRDQDGDGFSADLDCNDTNAAIRPGAVEIRGNGIDDNCDRIREGRRTVATGIFTGWTARGARVSLVSLKLTQLEKGATATIRCAGRRCPFRERVLKGRARGQSVDVLRSLAPRQRRFRAGQTIDIHVSEPNLNAKVSRWRLKRAQAPVGQSLCLEPGATRPHRTCADGA